MLRGHRIDLHPITFQSKEGDTEDLLTENYHMQRGGLLSRITGEAYWRPKHLELIVSLCSGPC